MSLLNAKGQNDSVSPDLLVSGWFDKIAKKSNQPMKKALVTGASGFIGSFLVEHLLAAGYQVKVIIRTSSSLEWLADLDVECLYGRLDDRQLLERAVRDVDYIFHLAGKTRAQTDRSFYEINYKLTKNLLEIVSRSNPGLKKFTYLSSFAAAGPSRTIDPVTEEDLPAPVSSFGKSKLATERLFFNNPPVFPFVILRPALVFGPRDRVSLQFFRLLNKSVIPQINGMDHYVSLIYVKDLVNALLAAAESEETNQKIYFVAAPKAYSVSELSRLTLILLGKKGFRLHVPHKFLAGYANFKNVLHGFFKGQGNLNSDLVNELKYSFWICSSAKFQEELPFSEFHSMEESLQETIDWYSGYGWL